MGSMLRSSATAAYLVLAALFFSAAAFANLNDPDPLWWVVAYVGGGVALPAAHALESRPARRRQLLGAAAALAAALGVVISVFSGRLWPRLDFGLPLGALAWSALEEEEGREAVGLTLLLLHVLHVASLLLPEGEGGGRSSRVSAGAMLALGGAVVAAIGAWVFARPDMIAKQGVAHCEGAFGGLSQLLGF